MLGWVSASIILMVWIKISPVVQTYIGGNIQPKKIRDNLYIEYTTLRALADQHSLQLKELFDPATDILLTLEAERLLEPQPSAQHKRWVEELKGKHERRMYDLLVDKKNASKNYFQRQPDGGMRQLEKTVTFAMTFLFSFLLAGVTGFCLGRYFFGWEQIDSMKMAIAFIVMTIFVETGLFIIKINRMTSMDAQKRKAEDKRYYNYTVRQPSSQPSQSPAQKKNQ